MTFEDFEKPFDSFEHHIILESLKNAGIIKML